MTRTLHYREMRWIAQDVSRFLKKKLAVQLQTDPHLVTSPVFGVITYSINDARSGEFDDRPVM